MKFAIASIFLATVLLSSTEAREVNRERQLKKSKSSKSGKSAKSSSSSSSSSDEVVVDPARQALIGDCTMLTNSTFEVMTGYDLTENTIYTYPCSGSYVRFHGSNFNLQTDVAAEINRIGKEMGSTADCSNLCDIDNGSYDTVSKTGMGTIADFANSDILCDANSPLLNSNGDFDGDQCRCDPDGDGYIAGCAKCMGVVSFQVNLCLDTSAFAGTTAPPVVTEAPAESSSSSSEDATEAPAESSSSSSSSDDSPTRAPILADDDK